VRSPPRPRDSKELLRLDSPAAAPPGTNFCLATLISGGVAVAPKKYDLRFFYLSRGRILRAARAKGA